MKSCTIKSVWLRKFIVKFVTMPKASSSLVSNWSTCVNSLKNAIDDWFKKEVLKLVSDFLLDAH